MQDLQLWLLGLAWNPSQLPLATGLNLGTVLAENAPPCPDGRQQL